LALVSRYRTRCFDHHFLDATLDIYSETKLFIYKVLVHLGARFTPCIRPVPSLTPSTLIGNCYRSDSDTCTVEQLCGGFPADGIADQFYRLILPIFMHAGIIHFLLNMLTHLRLGVDLERALGTSRYVVLYMASGIWGFVLSAMLSQNLTASTGCSGALFGLIGYMFIDVLVNWKVLPNPMRDLMSLLFSTIISLVLGLLPGLDNFAHIGKKSVQKGHVSNQYLIGLMYL
jgi:membrane associated rhomboid family serine protease